MRVRQLSLGVSLVTLLSCLQPALASDRGSLVVRVSPKETYIYADGKPVYEAKGHYITLDAGEHKIDLYNYGFKPETRTVTITAHKSTKIDVTMQAIPGVVSGPWGAITVEGPHGAAILLNGKDPAAFFVGNIKEFDNEFLWKKELIVPPGQQQLTVAYTDHDPWTVTVNVEPNKRVVVDAFKGVRKTVAWSRGDQLKELPRCKGGILNDHVAVEKVTGNFSASSGQVACGESAHLTWTSNGATQVLINDAPVSASGDQTISPKQNATYKFTAVGPGGSYTSDATVNVNNSINASLNVSPSDVSGQNSNPSNATLSWTANGADNVSIDPIGTVSADGSQQVPVTPGAQAQDVTYTLHATNSCGGSETRTASLHIGATEVANSTPPPAETETAANQPPPQLPHTASQLPLIGLTGMLFLGAAALFRLIAKASA
jgi:hypothetical protein